MFTSLKRFAVLTLLMVAVSPILAMRVTFDYRVFHAPEIGPYAEFVTSFDASTFQHRSLDSGYVQANAELMLVLSGGGKILDARKVLVDGPQIKGNDRADFLSSNALQFHPGNTVLSWKCVI